MDDTLVIDSVEMLKVFADPLRQQLLQAFCCNPGSVKQAAEQLGEKPTRLYHHVELLEQNGFLEVVDTKQIRGTVEKTYRTVARKIIVDHALVGNLEDEGGESAEKNIVINAIQACLVDARDHFNDSAERQSMILAQATLKLSPSRIKKLEEKIDALIQEISADDEEDADQVTYSFTAACFPITKSTCC